MIKRKHFIDIAVLGILTILAIAGGLAYAESSSADSQTQEQLQKIEQKLSTSSAKPVLVAKKSVHSVGTLAAINGTSLLLTTEHSLVTILTNANTKFIALNPKTAIKIEDLKVGDRLAAVGVSPFETLGLASLVAKLPTKTTYTATFGKISTVGAASLTLSHVKYDEISLGSITIASGTAIKSASKSLTVGDLKNGDTVVVSSTVDEKGTSTAKLIQVISPK